MNQQSVLPPRHHRRGEEVAMASNNSNAPSPPGSTPPPKPWEQAGSSSGASPFKPQSGGRTSDVVEASGSARLGEVVANGSTLPRPVPPRPWMSNYSNGGYGCGMYGASGGYGGLYGNNMYSGSGFYGGGFGGPMGGYGMGMNVPFGNQDPNTPSGPPTPPGFWMSFLRAMQGVANFFGLISILIDQNTQAFHFFMSALLQLFDRSGVLYGELARFVFRLLGLRRKPRNLRQFGPGGFHGPKASTSSSWENVWGDESYKRQGHLVTDD